jgi:hypothetical protein
MKKHLIVISLVFAVAALALLAGCSNSDSASSDPVVAEAESCFECHTGDTMLGNKILGAKAQYVNSGHYNGPRTLDPNYVSTGHTWLFHGSNAMYTNGSPCSNCHTHQGFVEFVATGTIPNIGAASQPGCFTCHEPHETGDFVLRTQTAVTLVDGVTVFDKGKGNLCAKCHQSRTKVGSGVTATNTSLVSGFPGLIAGSPYSVTPSTTAPKNFQRWSSSSGMHHGPQADFITGANNWVYTKTTVTYQGVSKHYSTTAAPDSCVACHMFEPAGRLGGTLQLGGHGMYLTGDVHGTETDIVAVCKTCHVSTGPGSNWPTAVTATTFEDSNHTEGDIDGDGSTDDILVEIDHLKKALLTYFGESSNFLTLSYTLDGNKNYTGYSLAASTDGEAPVTDVATGLDYIPGSTYEWSRDWEFNGFSPTAVDFGVILIPDAYPAMNKWQSQSFWNFKYFMEDRSGGIHNPMYAAQTLYDAVMNLNDNGVAKAVYGMGSHASASGLGTRPQ